MTTTVEKTQQTPFIIRALWFLVFGWELTAVWIAVAWVLNITIVGLPLGVWMLDRVPQVLTLKSMGGTIITNEKSGESIHRPQSQMPFLIRALYFVVIGWWASLLWAVVGYLLCLTIFFLPFGLIMLNNLPFVTTLRR